MPPEPDPFATAPSRSRADILVRSVNRERESAAGAIAGAARLIERIQADPALPALLEANAFGPRAIEAGVALLAAAQEQFHACERAIASHDSAVVERDALWGVAREEYLEFRATVRIEFGDAHQRRLGVMGVLAGGVLEFVAQAANSYRAAETPGFAAKLARRNFSRRRLLEARRLLEQLLCAEQLADFTADRLKPVADERQLAVAMLNLWMVELLHAFRCAFGQTRHPPSTAVAARSRSGADLARVRVPRRQRQRPSPSTD